MVYFLNAICNDYALAEIISIVKRIIDIMRLITPIFLILGVSIALVKGVINPEDKSTMKKIFAGFEGTILLIFLPFIIDVLMSLISTYGGVGIREGGKNIAFDISNCWDSSSITKTNMDSSVTTSSTSIKKEATSSKSSSNSANTSKKKKTSSNSQNNLKNKSKSSSSTSNSSSKTNKTYNKVTLIGDSRFYGQSNYNLKNSKTEYIAKSSEGLSYLKSNESKIKSKDSEDAAFVINLGVNDLYNADNYISYINSLASSLKGDVYYLSVNPVDEQKGKAKGYNVSNSSIDSFNSKMKSGLKNVKFLDSNSYLKQNGYSTVDGVHYTKETYESIYNFIANNVKS